MQTRIPFSTLDIELLTDELRRLSEDRFLKLIVWLGLSLIIALIPSRTAPHESIFNQFGFFKGLLISLAFIGIFFLWDYFSKRSNYQKDLRDGVKISQEAKIIRKGRPFKSKGFEVMLKVQSSEPLRFPVELKIYQELKIGQTVTIEYAPNSMFLLKISANA